MAIVKKFISALAVLHSNQTVSALKFMDKSSTTIANTNNPDSTDSCCSITVSPMLLGASLLGSAITGAGILASSLACGGCIHGCGDYDHAKMVDDLKAKLAHTEHKLRQEEMTKLQEMSRLEDEQRVAIKKMEAEKLADTETLEAKHKTEIDNLEAEKAYVITKHNQVLKNNKDNFDSKIKAATNSNAALEDEKEKLDTENKKLTSENKNLTDKLDGRVRKYGLNKAGKEAIIISNITEEETQELRDLRENVKQLEQEAHLRDTVLTKRDIELGGLKRQFHPSQNQTAEIRRLGAEVLRLTQENQAAEDALNAARRATTSP